MNAQLIGIKPRSIYKNQLMIKFEIRRVNMDLINLLAVSRIVSFIPILPEFSLDVFCGDKTFFP